MLGCIAGIPYGRRSLMLGILLRERGSMFSLRLEFTNRTCTASFSWKISLYVVRCAWAFNMRNPWRWGYSVRVVAWSVCPRILSSHATSHFVGNGIDSLASNFPSKGHFVSKVDSHLLSYVDCKCHCASSMLSSKAWVFPICRDAWSRIILWYVSEIIVCKVIDYIFARSWSSYLFRISQ